MGTRSSHGVCPTCWESRVRPEMEQLGIKLPEDAAGLGDAGEKLPDLARIGSPLRRVKGRAEQGQLGKMPKRTSYERTLIWRFIMSALSSSHQGPPTVVSSAG